MLIEFGTGKNCLLFLSQRDRIVEVNTNCELAAIIAEDCIPCWEGFSLCYRELNGKTSGNVVHDSLLLSVTLLFQKSFEQ